MAAPRRWRDLRTRAISAAVLVPPGLACLWLGGLAWGMLVALAVLGLTVEWVGLCRGRPVSLAAGLLYLAVPAAALVWLRGDPRAGLANALVVLLTVWASDIGAYAVGRLVGGPLLAPRISPAKTWAGAIGGLAAAMLTATACALLWPGVHTGAATLPAAAAVGAALGLAAQAGDLAESALKRRFGVKDSGRLIPGHGGLLDRLDGLLAAAPAGALLALLLGRGVILWE